MENIRDARTWKTPKYARWARRVALAAVAVIVAAGAIAVMLWNHPQALVGLFQGYQSQNSFEPRASEGSQVRANGIRYVNDITYGEQYPNSHLDISYPAGAGPGQVPTVVFAHGGGFFGGDKVLGDPLAVDSDVNYLFDSIVEQGFAVVNMNYALVPEHHFPTPVHQLDQALEFLRENSSSYQLDMDNVIIMGSSAGAIMAAQYGAALANPGYAELLGVTPSIPLDSVRAVVIDDAPLAIDGFNLATMLLIGNYIDGTMHPSEQDRERYDPINHVNGDYPPTFLIGSNYNGDGYARDMELLAASLESKGVQHQFFYEKRADGSEANHGLLGGLATGDELAVNAFEQILQFIHDTPAE